MYIFKIVSLFDCTDFMDANEGKLIKQCKEYYIILSNIVSEKTAILHQGITKLNCLIRCVFVCLILLSVFLLVLRNLK